MASLVPGYDYDIFVSYRKKDNQYDGWVTEFVNNLRKEIAATFKEDVSLYFDENQHDGVLDTHQVRESILEKLKCVVFIPVLSQTYCDENSFAWKHEFLPFLKWAREDRWGLKVQLPAGNVVSRALPVRIHEINQYDRTLIECELGPLRCVDFIYKTLGVNRPLRAREDRPFDNHYPVFYRDQINKMANSIREIIIGMMQSDTVKHAIPSYEVAQRKSQMSIAVLPFVNMSNDADQEYFSDGISEEIINMLVQIPGLYVAGRTSSFSFKNKSEDLRLIGEKLNVDYVLEGSVRKSGNMIRITAQLIEAGTGYHHWSEKYDRELRDVFSIQDEIALAIVTKMKTTFKGSVDKPSERSQTNNVEAYQLYLKGRALYYKRGLEMFEALRCFEAALKLDPDYALAWTGLTDTYSMLCFHSFLSPEVVWPKVLYAAHFALETGPDLAEVHAALGTIALLYERNFDKAESKYLKALELNPKNMQARTWYGLFYLQGIKGFHEKAIEQAKISIGHDPLSAYTQAILALTSIRSGTGDGIEPALKSVEYDFTAFLPWYVLGNCYHWSENYKKATEAFNHALEISGRHAWALTSLMINYTDAGQQKEADILFYELLTRSRTGYVLPSLMAMAAAAGGKNKEAISYAFEAIKTHDPFLVQCYKIWPDNKYLMAIPEYLEIIELIERT